MVLPRGSSTHVRSLNSTLPAIVAHYASHAPTIHNPIVQAMVDCVQENMLGFHTHSTISAATCVRHIAQRNTRSPLPKNSLQYEFEIRLVYDVTYSRLPVTTSHTRALDLSSMAT